MTKKAKQLIIPLRAKAKAKDILKTKSKTKAFSIALSIVINNIRLFPSGFAVLHQNVLKNKPTNLTVIHTEYAVAAKVYKSKPSPAPKEPGNTRLGGMLGPAKPPLPDLHPGIGRKTNTYRKKA